MIDMPLFPAALSILLFSRRSQQTQVTGRGYEDPNMRARTNILQYPSNLIAAAEKMGIDVHAEKEAVGQALGSGNEAVVPTGPASPDPLPEDGCVPVLSFFIGLASGLKPIRDCPPPPRWEPAPPSAHGRGPVPPPPWGYPHP